MPFYVWQGVDLAADYRHGVSFARSQTELEVLLFERDIALIKSRQKRFMLFGRSIPLAQKIAFFKQAAVLLSSGLHIPKMLTTIIAQCSDIYFKEILITVRAHVQEGMLLSDAMAQYREQFSAVMIQMIAVGQTSGMLTPAMDSLSDYLESMELFRKKIRATILLPCITLAFFLVMVLVMLLVVVPQFNDIFHSLDAHVPWITSVMMSISNGLSNWWVVAVVVVVLGSILGIAHHIFMTKKNKWFHEKMLQVPVIGSLIGNMTIVNTMHACGVLLKSGVHMISALEIAQFVISNSILRERFDTIIRAVHRGVPFHEAMHNSGMPFAQDDIIAMLVVGQESSDMTRMMLRISGIYREKVEHMLEKITVLIQPALIFVLGILIMSMIIAIYAPLFNMAHLV